MLPINTYNTLPLPKFLPNVAVFRRNVFASKGYVFLIFSCSAPRVLSFFGKDKIHFSIQLQKRENKRILLSYFKTAYDRANRETILPGLFI